MWPRGLRQKNFRAPHVTRYDFLSEEQDTPAKIAKPANYSAIKRSTEDVTVAGTTYTC
ncbi:MAG TPA: hypothetical protein VH370_16835 [Humisphaera sp.]|jgi:hypothetical protein|nr:hypothetical protein [Humisphaera sp.]